MGKSGIYIVFFGLLVALAMIPSFRAWGYPVPPLPDDNLLTNPWFRSVENPAAAGLEGWTNDLSAGVGWGISQKESNPSPEILVSGVCGFEPVYCGTGARWANISSEDGTESYPDVDVFLHQVVSTDSSHRHLNFSMYWVNHRLEVGEVIVYGSDRPDGPWELVWQPITISQDENPSPCCVPGHNGIPWFKTGPLETTLEIGYRHYKVILHARYPDTEIEQGDVGVKITGVYFAAHETDAPTNGSTPVVVHDPTVDPTYGPPTVTPSEPTATNMPTSSPTAAPTASSTATAKAGPSLDEKIYLPLVFQNSSEKNPILISPRRFAKAPIG
jgi:hypothetical protein